MRTAALLAAVPLARREAEREVSVSAGGPRCTERCRSPEGTARKLAVLLIAGSGPTDRDGNSALPGVGPATLKLLARLWRGGA